MIPGMNSNEAQTIAPVSELESRTSVLDSTESAEIIIEPVARQIDSAAVKSNPIRDIDYLCLIQFLDLIQQERLNFVAEFRVRTSGAATGAEDFIFSNRLVASQANFAGANSRGEGFGRIVEQLFWLADRSLLIYCEDFVIKSRAESEESDELSFRIAGRSEADLLEMIREIRLSYPAAPAEPELEDGTIPVSIWNQSRNGARERTRTLNAQEVVDIRNNYSAETLSGVKPLLEPNFRPDSAGKLLLWHGAPGVGKTNMILSLAYAWRDWCTTEMILDPELFFGDADYMTEVVLGQRDSGESDQWRLLVIEDAGEMILAENQNRTNQALARLLNLTDGLIGQGINLMVLITTNEEFESLNGAVVRAGRCLNNTEFKQLSQDEANAWLKARGAEERVSGSSTLADLYQIGNRESKS